MKNNDDYKIADMSLAEWGIKENPPTGLRFRSGGQGGGAAVVRALPQGRGKGDVRVC